MPSNSEEAIAQTVGAVQEVLWTRESGEKLLEGGWKSRITSEGREYRVVVLDDPKTLVTAKIQGINSIEVRTHRPDTSAWFFTAKSPEEVIAYAKDLKKALDQL